MAETNHVCDVSRRSFVKGSLTAAVGAGAASWLTGCSPKPVADTGGTESEPTPVVEDNDEIFRGTCRCNCYGGCYLNIHVRDGKIVRTSMRDLPETAWNRICSKGLTHPYRVYDPNRAKYPMRRAGERGEGKWEQITWDEALDEIAQKFTQYAQEFGPDSVGIASGAGNYGFLDLMPRFQARIGASTVGTPLDFAPFYSLNPMVGMSLNFHGNEMTDLVNSKTLVIWGSNPAVSQIQGMHFIMEAREQGTKVISIDPVYTATTAKCDQWIPLAPGTDGMLAIGLMKIVLEKGWQDDEFIRSTTVAPFLVKEDGEYLRLSDLGRAEAGAEDDVPVATDGKGTFDAHTAIANAVVEGTYDYQGQKVTCAWTLMLDRLSEYDLEECSKVCDVPVDVMTQLAEDIAVNKPCALYILLGIDHYQNGFYSIYDMGCLAAMTGNIGKPGAFCGISEAVYFGLENAASPYGAYTLADATPSTVNVPVFRMEEALEAGEWLGNPYTLKALWVYKRNLLANLCDRESMLRWLEKVELIVVSELTMNEMGRYADIFLPVCHWFEMEDFAHQCPQNVFITIQDKAIDPLYECRSDFDIIKDLAGRMSYGDDFNFTAEDWMRGYLDSETCQALGISYDKLKEEGALRAIPGSPEAPFIHGGDGIPTATGKVEFYQAPSARYASTAMGEEPDFSHFGLPYWEPAGEVVPEDARNEKYPYQVMSEHQRLRTHSQWVNVPVMRELDPEPSAKLHPDTAEAHRIAEGDYMRIYNDRGEVVVKAHLSDGVRPGILLCSRGWEDADFVKGHLQDVLSDEVSNLCVTQAFFDTTAAIEKAEV